MMNLLVAFLLLFSPSYRGLMSTSLVTAFSVKSFHQRALRTAISALGATTSTSSYTPILDFSKPNTIDMIDRLDDAIMGGISTSTVVQANATNENASSSPMYAKWFGVCRTDGGGFCGFRTNPFREPLQVAEEAEGLYVVARLASDDEPERRAWKMSTRTDQGRGEVVYQAPFIFPSSKTVTAEEWSCIEIPFTDFRLVRGPRQVPNAPPINTTKGLYQIGITMSKFAFGQNASEIENFRDGFFQLDMREIGFYTQVPNKELTVVKPNVLSKQEAKKKRPFLLKVLSPVGNIFFSEKSRRRKSAMKIIRKKWGLSRLQAIVFGWKSRAKSKGVLSALGNTAGILAMDTFRLVVSTVLRIALVYPIILIFKIKNAVIKDKAEKQAAHE